MTEGACLTAGCLWDPVEGQPTCFLPDSNVYGYYVRFDLHINL